MKRVNALKLRQSMGAILDQLDQSGEPVIVEKGRTPRAVLISLKDFQERFVDKVATAERQELVERILAFRRTPTTRGADPRPATDILRDVRGPIG